MHDAAPVMHPRTRRPSTGPERDGLRHVAHSMDSLELGPRPASTSRPQTARSASTPRPGYESLPLNRTASRVIWAIGLHGLPDGAGVARAIFTRGLSAG